jgi:hypothetical protein
VVEPKSILKGHASVRTDVLDEGGRSCFGLGMRFGRGYDLERVGWWG